MPLILGTNSIKETGYEVANSLRFDDGSSHSLNHSQANGNRRTFTFSAWVKTSVTGSRGFIFHVNNAGHYTYFGLDDDGKIEYYDIDGATQQVNWVSNRMIRDPSAWFHIVLRVDMTQAAEADRIKIYVNGVEETSWSSSQTPSQNTDLEINVSGHTFRLGTYNNSSTWFDGYLAEVVFCDGQSLDPTSFGEFDSDSPTIWKPIDVSGLTFGTNGFYLDFENSSNLGADVSGQGNNFTVNNLTSVNQSTDTCTNNFCTLNKLDNYYQSATFSEGNCKLVTAGSSNTAPTLGTFGLTAGKWYWEAKFVSDSQGSSYGVIGIEGAQVTSATDALLEGTQSYGLYLNDGKIWTNNSSNNHGSHIDLNAIIGVALDLDNNRIYFSKDGQWGDGSGNWDEASPNNYLSITDPASVALGAYFPAHGDWSSGTIGWEVNFGGTNTYSISSGNSDGNGYGNFEYAIPSGYYSLCSKNLAEYG